MSDTAAVTISFFDEQIRRRRGGAEHDHQTVAAPVSRRVAPVGIEHRFWRTLSEIKAVVRRTVAETQRTIGETEEQYMASDARPPLSTFC